jgi:predicted transcriptional regulator
MAIPMLKQEEAMDIRIKLEVLDNEVAECRNLLSEINELKTNISVMAAKLDEQRQDITEIKTMHNQTINMLDGFNSRLFKLIVVVTVLAVGGGSAVSALSDLLKAWM